MGNGISLYGSHRQVSEWGVEEALRDVLSVMVSRLLESAN